MKMNDFDSVKDKVDIREFIDQETGAQAKKVGTDTFRINPCPFCNHDDCFTIHANTNSAHCYSCGFSGDVFNFAREYHNLTSNYEALRYVAEKIGYTITNENTAKQDAKLLDIKQLAVGYYHNNLIEKCKDEPINYLQDKQEHETSVLEYQIGVRKHSLDILKKERVGYADGKFVEHAKSKGYGIEDLRKAGLANKQGQDYFPKGVYVYPHFVYGQISHFSQKDPMKAIEFQSKKEHRHPHWRFYGQSAINADDLIAVEGENDRLKVIDKAKCPHVIATIGQLSEAQIEYLKQKRKGKRTYLCFDNDNSGREYTNKVISTLGGYDIFVMRFCPLWKDVDELLSCADEPQEVFEQLKENAIDQYEYQLKSIPEDTELYDVLDTIKPILKNLLDHKGKAHVEAFVKTKVKERFDFTLDELKAVTRLAKELEKAESKSDLPGEEKEVTLVWTDKPIRLDFSLAQDFVDGILHYTIYLPVDIEGHTQLMPHLITSEREAVLITREVLEERNIYVNEIAMPSNMNRWSVDTQTDFSVHHYLNKECEVGSFAIYRDLHRTFTNFLWHPDLSLATILSLWTMESYVFMIFDSIGYLAAVGTKRTGKTRMLELLGEVAFNAIKLGGQSDAYTFRKIENDRVTLLMDEADRLARQAKAGGSNIIEHLRDGYKRTGQTGLCEGEAHRPTEFSTYSMKAFANVEGVEEMLGDRVIVLLPERKPLDEPVARLLMRRERSSFQLLRNKLYVWALTHAKQIHDAYVNLEIPDEYKLFISDREEEIWAGLLAIAKVIDDDKEGVKLFKELLDIAKTNKQRKVAEESTGSIDAQFLEALLDFLLNGEPNVEYVDGKPYFRQYEIERHIADFLGWVKVSSTRFVSKHLKRLRIIDDVGTDRIRKVVSDYPIITEKDGERVTEYVKKRIALYHLDIERVKEVAVRYDVQVTG